MKSVQHISKAKFKISTVDVPESEILLDFNPVIEQFQLRGKFYLIHWQARPKGHREYGVYNFEADSYISGDNFPVSYGSHQLLMLDDLTAATVPSAVICFRGYFNK